MRSQVFAITSDDASIPHEVKANQWVKHIRKMKDYSHYWYYIFDSTLESCAFIIVTDEKISEAEAKIIGNTHIQDRVTLSL
jgi:hypothetical protein